MQWVYCVWIGVWRDETQSPFLIKSLRAGAYTLWQSEKTWTRGSPAVWERLTGDKVRKVGGK